MATPLCRSGASFGSSSPTMSNDFREQLESDFHVAAEAVIGNEFRSVCRRWLNRFCPSVKRNTGNWVYNGYWWHAYSFNHEIAVTGIRAFENYQSKPIEPFFVFHESYDFLFDCSASTWPDLRSIEDDIHVFPHKMTWAFLTTHEMSMGLGPYFVLPPT